MMFENKNSERKDIKKVKLGYLSLGGEYNENSAERAEQYSVPITPEWDAMKNRTKSRIDNLTKPVDEDWQEQRFRNSYANYMLPKDTPERHRRNYALSNAALDDVTGDYYNEFLKDTFDKKRKEGKKRQDDEYMRYISVPGADPVNAYRASLRVNDPVRTVDETMADVDDEYLLKQVAPLASYGGYDAKEYVDKLVKPSLREKMIGELVDENTPKSSPEYVMRSAFGNSLVGKFSSIGSKYDKGTKNRRMLRAEGLANYDSNRVEDFVAGVGSLLIDYPLFSGLGSLSSSIVGGATTKTIEKISSKVLSRYKDKTVSKEFADAVARKIVVDRLKSRILQSATANGLTLGGYDVANSVADDILYNDEINLGKTVGSFVKGFTTGAAVGATGTVIKARTKGLTGGKRLFSSAGVLSAESAIFTVGGELDKLAHGIKVEPVDLLYDYGESMATLLTMRMANWRPKGASNKLDKNGNIINELNLSKSERQELREANVDPEQFIAMLEKELSMPTLNSSGAKLLKENYATLMSSNKLSASAKSKLLYLVENKITSTPPVVFDYEVQKNSNGTWEVKLLDAGGRLVETLNFQNPGNAKSQMILRRGGIRKNRIAYYERELTSGIDSQNFLHEAGLYVKEKSLDADIVAEAMYKSARKEQLNSAEMRIMNELVERTKFYESQISRTLSNARREIEKRYNLGKGALLNAVDKRFIECSSEENKALDEYEAFVRSEVEGIKEREASNFVNSGVVSYVNNEDIKRQEVDDYRLAEENKHAGQGTTESTQSKSLLKIREIPETAPGYVWNSTGREVKIETVEELKRHGVEFSKRLGQDIVFITDEHQIERPDAGNPDAVMEYNTQLSAQGWVHKGKVYINLPNIKDFANLESTIVHEVVGHVGLKKVFGHYMFDFMEELYLTSDGTVRHGINKIKDAYGSTDMYTATEEYLATLIEKSYHNAKERNVLAKFKDFIKGMLIRHNIYKPKYRRISEKDLQSIMEAHCRYVLNRRNIKQHRTEVFNRFGSAHLGEEIYNNREAYGRRKMDMIANGSYTKRTPEKFRQAKYLVDYPYLPENVRKKIMEETKMSDEELREQSDAVNYRFEGKKGAKNYDNLYSEETEKGIDDAELLERHGLLPLQIKKLTGWERGADGEWRREVAENSHLVRDYINSSLFDNKPELAELYNEIKKIPYEAWGEKEKRAWDRIIKEGKRYMKNPVLKDIINDKEFFYSYPELVDMPVKIVENAPLLARYDSKEKEIVLDRNIFLSTDANRAMSAALQNVIQEYEGFSKAVSLRLLSLEGRMATQYSNAQKCIALVEGVRSNIPSFDKDNQIEKAFKREFGMDIPTFKKMFPTYDDYLFYKLTGKNLSFSGNVELDNVRKRYGMSEEERGDILAEETEIVPRERQITIKSLNDLEKYFTGPLDVINNYMRDIYSDEPIMKRQQGKDENNKNHSAPEYPLFDTELDSYTKYLLREMNKGEKRGGDPYGYEKYYNKNEQSKKKVKKKLDEYINSRGGFWNITDEDLDLLN